MTKAQRVIERILQAIRAVAFLLFIFGSAGLIIILLGKDVPIRRIDVAVYMASTTYLLWFEYRKTMKLQDRK